MIILLFIFLFLTFLINQFSIISRIKIFLNILVGSYVSFLYGNNFLEILDYIFFFFTYYFIVMNIYTTRYSSIRFLILDKIIKKQKIPNENWLFLNRKNRLQKNSSFMSKGLFELIYLLSIYTKNI